MNIILSVNSGDAGNVAVLDPPEVSTKYITWELTVMLEFNNNFWVNDFLYNPFISLGLILPGMNVPAVGTNNVCPRYNMKTEWPVIGATVN